MIPRALKWATTRLFWVLETSALFDGMCACHPGSTSKIPTMGSPGVLEYKAGHDYTSITSKTGFTCIATSGIRQNSLPVPLRFPLCIARIPGPMGLNSYKTILIAAMGTKFESR